MSSETLSWGLNRKTLETSPIMVAHFETERFITKLCLNVQLLLNFSTEDTRSTLRHQKQIGMTGDYQASEACLSPEGF